MQDISTEGTNWLMEGFAKGTNWLMEGFAQGTLAVDQTSAMAMVCISVSRLALSESICNREYL
jgi:hypothetical protein